MKRFTFITLFLLLGATNLFAAEQLTEKQMALKNKVMRAQRHDNAEEYLLEDLVFVKISADQLLDAIAKKANEQSMSSYVEKIKKEKCIYGYFKQAVKTPTTVKYLIFIRYLSPDIFTAKPCDVAQEVTPQEHDNYFKSLERKIVLC
jgi:hypothetical protein